MGAACVGEASVWRIETSPYECIAEWDTRQVSVVFLDNEETNLPRSRTPPIVRQARSNVDEREVLGVGSCSRNL